MGVEDRFKLNTKGKKVTLTIKGKNNTELNIETFVRDQFLYLNGIRYILRCDISKYVIDILRMADKIYDSLTITHLEIEGENFNFHPIELHADKNIILPVIEILVNPDRGKDKIEVYNAYIDKISYQAAHKVLSPFYNLEY